MKSFKSYINLDEDYDWTGVPFCEEIYNALIKGFERYYKANAGKYKSLKMDSQTIINDTEFLKSKFCDNVYKVIIFLTVCIEYNSLFMILNENIKDSEKRGEYSTLNDAYKDLMRIHTHEGLDNKTVDYINNLVVKNVYNNLAKDIEVV